ncbi:MAG TPA: heme-binding domain-containing protein [Thermoanaerobaculia bacterium]
MRRTKWVLLILVVVAVVIQFFRPTFTNPPVNPQHTIQASVNVPPNVDTTLRRACYNCHSSETRLPWYSKVAPVSWLLSSDINDGRQALSFSEFGTYSKKKEADKLKVLCDEVHGGDMPPTYYLPMHSSARLTVGDKQALCTWSSGERQRILASMHP